MGKVVTCYSYKGGVGRTMGLANIAVLLAQWGYKVLMVDWDLEAPGVEFYFKEYDPLQGVEARPGVLELLTKKDEYWLPYVITVNVPDTEGNLNLITSGNRNDNYSHRLRQLDIDLFYEEQDGGQYIEYLRNEWRAAYDFVLIDSRTGITDIGGICTIQMPDVLLLFFTANTQSLNGILDVTERVKKARQQLPFDRYGLLCVPLPSRFESNEEFRIAQEWLTRFAEALKELYANWLPKDMPIRDFLETTKIPYFPYFSFGEKLPVIEQGTKDPAGLGYAYATIAYLIANDFQTFQRNIIHSTSALIMEIEKPVDISSILYLKDEPPLVALIYDYGKDGKYVHEVREFLSSFAYQYNFRIWDEHDIKPGDSWVNGYKTALAKAKVIVVFVSGSERNLRQLSYFVHSYYNHLEVGEAVILPVYTEKASNESIPEIIQSFVGSNSPDTPLSELNGIELDKKLNEVGSDILRLISR